jgi:membrane protein DedA with SNARE-associated domain
VLTRLLAHFGYFAIAGLLVAGGVGVPVPEEIIQLTAGYLARRGVLEFVPALATVYGGIVLGDFLLFKLAQRHGERLLRTLRADRLMTAKRRKFVESHFERHAFLTIVVARHLSAFRVPVYILAATHSVRGRAFLLADGLSALLSVPLVVSLGYFFAARLEDVKRRVHQVDLALLVAAILAILSYGVVRLLRSRRRPDEG